MRIPWTLRSRLTLLILLATLPALGWVFYAAGEHKRQAIRESTQDLFRRSQLAAAHQTQLVRDARQLLTALGRLPMVRRRDVETTNILLAYLLGQNPRYLNFGVAKPDGTLFASALPMAEPVGVGDSAWFRRAIESGEFEMGNYQMDPIAKRPTVFFGLPVREDDELAHVVYAALSLDSMQTFLTPSAPNVEGIVLGVFDSSGVILARHPASERWVGLPFPDGALFRHIRENREGTARLPGVDGVERLYAFAPVPVSHASDLYVYLAIPLESAYRLAESLFRRDLIALASVVLLALAAAWFGSEALVLRPLKALLAGTRRMAAGDLSARVDESAGRVNELSELGRSFNEMAASLEATRKGQEQKEEELRQGEERLRLILENALDAVVVIDEKGIVIGWNPTAEAIFGRPAREAIGAPMAPLIIPERYRERHWKGLARFLETQTGPVLNKRIEISALRRDGAEFPVELSISPLRTGTGYVFSAFIRDITERKRAEERFRLAVEGSPTATVMIDRQGRIVLVNSRAESLFQYSRQEMLGQPVERLIPERFREAHPGQREGFFANPQLRAMGAGRDLFALRRDGVEVPVEIGLNPIETPDGPCVLASIVDITERKRIEEVRSRLAGLVEWSDDAIIGKTLDGVITSWNAGAQRVFGYAADEMVGQSILRLIPPELHDEERSILARLRKGERIHHFETRRRRKDGTLIDVSLTISPIRDGSGRIVGISKVARDITRRKQAEAEIRQLNASLEQRVAERTAELEAANRELESFSYSVSHDLRAPLRTLDGFSQALLEDHGKRLDESGRDYLRRIRRASQRMGRLIDDLLNLSRLTRAPLARGRIDLTALLHDIVRDLREGDPGRRVAVTIEPGMAAEGDPRLLRVALTNLLDNAWKFTRNIESAEIACGTMRVQGKKVFFIKDNGAGFDMAYADKLFGAFQRLHKATEFPGNGIGLATVQRVFRRHGGRVWAEGKVGAGATFYFTLGEDA